MSIIKRIRGGMLKIDITPSCNVRYVHRSKAAARIERFVADGGHAITYSHRGQAVAVTERFVADGNHAVGNVHRSQADATKERISANCCYGGNYNSLEIISLPCFE